MSRCHRFREQIAQIGIGFDVVHLAGRGGAENSVGRCFPPNDQAGEADPVAPALIVAGMERIAAVHDGAADGVFDQVGVDVDAPARPKTSLDPTRRGLALTGQGDQSTASYLGSAADWPPPMSYAMPKPRVAYFCAAQWPDFTPALTLANQ